jgi:rare lipoprotein A
MVAMNGPTPNAAPASAAFPGQLTSSSPFALIAPSAVPAAGMASADDVVLPDFGPIVPQRPDMELAQPTQTPFAMASLSYADERIDRAAAAFAVLESPLSSAAVIQSWKRANPNGNTADDYIAVGSFENEGAATGIAKVLAGYGRIEIEKSALDGQDWYSVDLYPDGRSDVDALLQAAWSHGATDALAVRD